jgi:hypothetical protein
MPVTVGGTSITFNDGTSQSTDAVGTVRSASDSIICSYIGGAVSSHSSVSSFSLGFTGSARFKLYVSGMNSYDGKAAYTGYIYLDKNGVRQGTWGKTSPGHINAANVNLSVKPGDIFTIGYYMNNYSGGWGSGFCNLGMA